MASDLTYQMVADLCFYADGRLFWKARSCVRAGVEVGKINKQGYRVTTIFKKHQQVHRLIWLLHYGEHPKGLIDHVNGIRSDNRIENLRLASSVENARNRGTTGAVPFKGVTLHRCGKFMARIHTKEGGRRQLGLFQTAEQASAAYQAAQLAIFGSFARCGAIQKSSP